MKQEDKANQPPEGGPPQEEQEQKPTSRMELIEEGLVQVTAKVAEQDDLLNATVIELAQTKEMMNLVIEQVSENGAQQAAMDPAQQLAAMATLLQGVLGPKKHAAKFGTNTTAKAVKDLKTGTVYPSLSKCAAEVAPEYFKDHPALNHPDGDPKKKFVWYELLKIDPDRFEIQGATA